jgi:hypothetical protein
MAATESHGHFCRPQARTRVAMSPWLELLLNVMAFAGFLAVATYHRPVKGDGPLD